jgi:hypothetical protein
MEDASKLAVRRTYYLGTTYQDSATIDRSLQSFYLSKLTTVYNATIFPATDTVFKILKIHAYNPLPTRHYLKADSNLAWMKNMRDNIHPTGEPTVDYLYGKYYMKVWAYLNSVFDGNAYLFFRNDSFANTSALAKLYLPVTGVTASVPDSLGGDGDEIIDTIMPNYTKLSFSHGWEACGAGCLKRRYWNFKVYQNCSVEYLGSYGDYLYTGLSELNNVSFRLFPNPTTGRLKVEPELPDMKITVIDILGQQLRTFTESEIDISDVSSGVYYLNIESRSGSKNAKIIKE